MSQNIPDITMLHKNLYLNESRKALTHINDSY